MVRPASIQTLSLPRVPPVHPAQTTRPRARKALSCCGMKECDTGSRPSSCRAAAECASRGCPAPAALPRRHPRPDHSGAREKGG